MENIRNHFYSYQKITELFFKHVNEFTLVLAFVIKVSSCFSFVEIASVIRLFERLQQDVLFVVSTQTTRPSKHLLPATVLLLGFTFSNYDFFILNC